MPCEKCGKETEGTQNLCSSCAQDLSINKEEKETPEIMQNQPSEQKSRSWSLGKIISILIVLAILGIGISGIINENFGQKEDTGFNADQVNTLKNLAYDYIAEEQSEKALEAFYEALSLTPEDSLDYHFISGEMAILENDPDSAIVSFNKAYDLDPDDYQINNTLALFYLDLDQIAPQYVNYPKALIHAKKAYEGDPDKSEIGKQNLALAYYFTDDLDQAISLLSTSDFVEYPASAYWLGFAYLGKEDADNARLYFQKAIDGGVEVSQDIYDFVYSN